MKVDSKYVRGYPQIGGHVFVNGAYLAKVSNKDYDFIRFEFLTHHDLKERDIFSINPVTREELKQLEVDKPHLFI